MASERRRSSGFSLTELLVALALSALLLGALGQVTGESLGLREQARARNDALEDARFALERMAQALRTTRRLVLPRPDDPRSAQDESDRDPGVLALTLDPALDRDLDGVADADNDGDGRIDEDPGGDVNFDLAPGLFGIDDDGDGTVDEQHTLSSGPLDEDDDEDDYANEDGWTGSDDDADGWRDEDPEKDMNGDGLAGIGGVDDDGDSLVDEGDKNDDDEDGLVDEDWLDTVVFYFTGTKIVERLPLPWDENGDTVTNGRDVTERDLVQNVARFRVRRLAAPDGGAPLVEITLGVTDATGEAIKLLTKVRVGAGP